MVGEECPEPDYIKTILKMEKSRKELREQEQMELYRGDGDSMDEDLIDSESESEDESQPPPSKQQLRTSSQPFDFTEPVTRRDSTGGSHSNTSEDSLINAPTSTTH